jgi:hypothetical protein
LTGRMLPCVGTGGTVGSNAMDEEKIMLQENGFEDEPAETSSAGRI